MHVILNLFQDPSEQKQYLKANKILKQVQNDVRPSI